MRIIDHNDQFYRRRWQMLGNDKFNGAFFYSKEIRKNIIPRVKTDRSWLLVNTYGICYDHSIVFIHNNVHPENYIWLKTYKDCVLVCGLKSTVKKMQKILPMHKAIYLPLSIDVNNVKSYVRYKDKDTAFVGRSIKKTYGKLPNNIDYLENMPRTRLLKELARYRKVYAVGRCALEAIALNCEVLPYDDRFPDPSIWKVLDNKEAAKMLQKKLDKIDDKNGKNCKRATKLIIATDNPKYIAKRGELKGGQFNGAYYYSKEIVKNIIPNVKTDRPWDTLGMKSIGTFDNAIVFIHHCIRMEEVYSWLKDYKNLVLVVSTPDCFEWATSEGYKTIYLPLSIDTEYVSQFKTKQTKDACFCGNIWSFRKQEIAETIPNGVDFQPPNICREELLKFMSKYKNVYAIGRCALEARCLGANILQCYKKYPVSHWKLLDNKEAAVILQNELDKIDG